MAVILVLFFGFKFKIYAYDTKLVKKIFFFIICFFFKLFFII
jgi:hypothetical protein